jgi:hypothetical protein
MGLASGCISDNTLPPVSPPRTAPSAPLSVRTHGDAIFLPDGLHPIHITVAAAKFWILVDDEPIVPDTPGPERASLLAIDADSGEVVYELALEDFPSHLIGDDEAVWVAHWGSGAVTRVDPKTGDVTATIDLELPFAFGIKTDKRLFVPNDIALGHGSLWVGTARGAIARIDVETLEVEIIELDPGAPGEIAVDSNGIWIAEDVAGLRHINAETGEETQIGLDQFGHSVSQLLLVGDDLYAVGDRLARTEGGDFRVDAGSFIAATEDSLSRVDLGSLTVTGGVPLQFGARFLGWVEGRAGIVESTGMFQVLEPSPGLLGEVFQIGQPDGWPLVQVGKETWLVENTNSVVRRLELTTSVGFALPFIIDDETEPRPVPDEAAVSRDWIELDRGPIEHRSPAVAIWTGDEIVFWGGSRGSGEALPGGAAYSPATNTWRMMTDSPLGTVSGPGWVWTGDELLIWDGRGIAAAWQPDDNTWRTVDDWPLAGWSQRKSVWTGEEILDVFRDLAVDPMTGETRPIADAPPLRASVVWADGYMVSINSDGAYDLLSDTWIEMPPSGFTPFAADGTAIGSQVVAVDHDMNASVYDPDANSWSPLPDVPLYFTACSPRIHTLGIRVVFGNCRGVAVLDAARERWTPLPLPLGETHPVTVIAADEDIYIWGAGFFRLRPGSLEQPRRLAVGISFLDIPEGWRTIRTDEVASSEVTVQSPQGEICLVSERHVGAVSALRLLIRHDPLVTEVLPYVGGEPANALQFAASKLDDRHHLVWASSSSDVVDIACDTPEALEEIAPRVWSPLQ